MVTLKLFFSFLKIGLFSFGGAYSFLPLVEREVVENHHWLDNAEFLDVAGMARIFPGALSIKFATYTGYKVDGVLGATVANLANILPPVLFVILASMVYARFKDVSFVKAGLEMMRYAVFAMIVVVAVRLIEPQQALNLKFLMVATATFALLLLTNIHPGFVIIGAGIVGAILG